MASGTTYQAIKRLAFLPEREANENGSTIGGQEYDDVFFIGGLIRGVVLEDVVITEALRTLSGTSVTVLDNDLNIILTSSSNIAVDLPAVPSTNQKVVIKKYSTGGNVATINGNGFNIDGNPTYPMGADMAWDTFQFNGSFWSIVS